MHLAEEIADMGKEQAHALRSALAQALAHLTKLKYSPAECRRQIEPLLGEETGRSNDVVILSY